MPGPMTNGDGTAFLRILYGDCAFLFFHQAEEVCGMNKEIPEEMPCRNGQAL
jgi:hypothetical protein